MGVAAPRPPMASPCAAWTRAAFQHSNEEIRAGVNMQYSRQWRVALDSIKYDNTWYYQSHCSLAEKWGTVESFTIYVLWMTVRIYRTNTSPKNLKEKKNHPHNPTPKFIIKNIAFWEWISVATGMT